MENKLTGENTTEGMEEETADDAVGTSMHGHGIGGPMGSKSNDAELFNESTTERKEDDEYNGKELGEKHKNGDDTKCSDLDEGAVQGEENINDLVEEEDDYAKAVARWAIGLVGLGVTLVAHVIACALPPVWWQRPPAVQWARHMVYDQNNTTILDGLTLIYNVRSHFLFMHMLYLWILLLYIACVSYVDKESIRIWVFKELELGNPQSGSGILCGFATLARLSVTIVVLLACVFVLCLDMLSIQSRRRINVLGIWMIRHAWQDYILLAW